MNQKELTKPSVLFIFIVCYFEVAIDVALPPHYVKHASIVYILPEYFCCGQLCHFSYRAYNYLDLNQLKCVIRYINAK